MRRDSFFRTSRQRGLSLIEFLVGITIGLIVVIAAVASLIIVRGSSRTMNDSAALEQQATLAMLQVGRPLSQTGAYNAFRVGTNPSGTASGTFINYTGNTQFDTRPIGVAPDNNTLSAFPLSSVAIFGIDGTGTPPQPDTLYISYAQSNDNSPSNNCVGLTVAGLGLADSFTITTPTSPKYDRLRTQLITQYGAVRRTVSVFSVDPATSSLTCDTYSPTTPPNPQPIAANVIDMRVSYLSIDAFGNVTYYQNAAAVNTSAAAALGLTPPAANTWVTINGVQVCLELVGDPVQTGQYDLPGGDCRSNNTKTITDNRLHRIVRSTFYLRNPLQTS